MGRVLLLVRTGRIGRAGEWLGGDWSETYLGRHFDCAAEDELLRSRA